MNCQPAHGNASVERATRRSLKRRDIEGPGFGIRDWGLEKAKNP
jgi:hypothetical protein